METTNNESIRFFKGFIIGLPLGILSWILLILLIVKIF